MYLDAQHCWRAIKDASLHILLPWSGEHLRILPWNEGCILESFQSGMWERSSLCIPLLSDALTGKDPCHPIVRFTSEIPAHIRNQVRLYSSDTLAMLQICAHSARAEQLLGSSPNLLWLLAPFIAADSGLESQKLQRVFGEKRHCLLERFCGRGAPWIVRLLDRLEAAQHMKNRKAFHELLHTPHALESMRHCRQLSWSMIDWAAECRELFLTRTGCAAFSEGGSLDCLVEKTLTLYDLLYDTLRLGKELHIRDYGNIVKHCRTLRSLAALHDAWSERLCAIVFSEVAARPDNILPPPPLPGNKNIVPVRSYAELLEEGHAMQHCAGSYAESVRNGHSYIYKVLNPERATLEIARAGASGWAVAQIRGVANSRVTQETLRCVERWMREGLSGAGRDIETPAERQPPFRVGIENELLSERSADT